MKIPIFSGRDFNEADREGATNVAIVDETMWRRYFPGVDPLGKHFKDVESTYEIVGVSAKRKLSHIEQRTATVHLLAVRPTQQARFNSQMMLHVRSAASAPHIYAGVRQEVALIDRNLPLQEPMAVSEYINSALTAR